MLLYKNIARRFPELNVKLLQVRRGETPEYYVKKTLTTALMLSGGLSIIIFMFTKSFGAVLVFPFLAIIMFFYFLRQVDLQVEKIHKMINTEIVYAGRFLIIELESGVPMYQTFKNLAKNYENLGRYFQEIVDNIDLGTTMEDAINEALTLNPSPELRKILWQILNSMKTGSNVMASLKSVLDQIVREQQIAVNEYGRKLNPLAMFYMMIAVIVPSLGTTIMVVLATFLGLNISLVILLVIAMLLGFVQFMFLAMIRSSRPPMDV
ncbi:MAG: type II secretion system F family protein [Candidatus Woesearchaeota archaeon]